MANDGRKGGALDEMGQLTRRFNSPEEEEALALETLGTAGIAGMGPQVCAIYIYMYIYFEVYIYIWWCLCLILSGVPMYQIISICIYLV